MTVPKNAIPMGVIQFILDTKWEDLPAFVTHQAKRCLLDTIGVAVAARRTGLSEIVHGFAASVFGGRGARLWLDGREVSPPGAALANGMSIDALDAHDGYALAKGHAGAAIIPALFSTLSLDGGTEKISGKELITTLVVGYETALRSGVALHATACDYHTSGAWNALGCAAVTARRMGLPAEKTRHALGIAEYHGPRSQMMRCIDHPTMLKDGSGWGAMTGVSAALLARDGFTGAPALTVEGDDVEEIWARIGKDWFITDLYFKPHAVCRWAQPAVEGALQLKRRYRLDPGALNRIKVHTFHEATRLDTWRPDTTEEAQYSLPFPLAAALVSGTLGRDELDHSALKNGLVLDLAKRVELLEDEGFNERFPAERFSRVEIETKDGGVLDSGVMSDPWLPDEPPTDRELQDKFKWMTRGIITESRTEALKEHILRLDDLPDGATLLELITSPWSAR